MKIKVNYTPSHWVAGEEDTDFWYCQHPSTHTDAIEENNDYEAMTQGSALRVWLTPIEVCDDCDAYHHALDDDGADWQNGLQSPVKRLGVA